MSMQDAPETQAERTRLSWRRTMIGVLAVGAVGSLHLLASGLAELSLAASVIALIACLPMWHRQRVLRTSVEPPTWQPLALTVICCVLALSVLLAL